MPGGGVKNARQELEDIVKALQLSVDFSPEVLAETQRWIANPHIDDPALVDFTATPFVTVDGEHSKDLDQALHVAREGDGYLVAYAIADASFYVRPGSALFAEAMKRGASYYFPGFSVPMLPRPLSEGLISLNPDGDRRALVFLHHLDGSGALKSTELKRSRVRSRAKLSFGDVQKLVDAPDASPLKGRDFEGSLMLLREVGRKRMDLAAKRGLIRYRREEVSVQLDGEGVSFAVMEAVRDEVESWNEQLSLMCNAEGGRLLREFDNPAVQPIYRVQGGPEPERLDSLARLTVLVAKHQSLPTNPWVWNQSTTALANYLGGLPRGAPGSKEERLGAALTRQAVMVNLRSEYSTEPGPHVGVGAEPYARFSAPMREMVGVFLHKEAVELLTGNHPTVEEDEKLRGEVVQVANKARATQRRVQDLANEVVMNRLFAPELTKAPKERTRFIGTVMGLTHNKVHVRLDVPPLDVKLYLFDLAPYFDGAWLEPADEGALLRKKGTTTSLLLLGQAIQLFVARRDEKTRRWIFSPER
ncbi:MAG: RNB domain-containing ribonuclease [Archangium sp.]|nr:RNB domain-containing ribonuclease [Archangium sp.]